MNTLEVWPTPDKGRGVFACVPFAKGDTIEIAPVIVIPAEHWNHIEPTILERYIYTFGPEKEDVAVALGFGSLYNHSFTPNAEYIKVWETQVIRYVALRDIREGEEITINYNGSPESRKPMDFEVTP